MADTITGNAGAGYSTTATVPADGDVRNAASVKVPFQRLLDNIAWLYNELVTLGAKKLRLALTFAALRAVDVTGVADGEGRYVPAYGYYTFDSTLAGAETLPWIVAPTVGAGLWVHELAAVRDVYFPAMAAGGKIDADVVPMATLEVADYTNLGAVTSVTGSTDWTDTAASVTLATNAAIGDVLELDAEFILETSDWTTPVYARARLGVSENGAAVAAVANTERTAPIGALGSGHPARVVYSMRKKHVVTAAGPVVVKVQIKIDNAAQTAYLAGPGSLTVRHVRP